MLRSCKYQRCNYITQTIESLSYLRVSYFLTHTHTHTHTQIYIMTVENESTSATNEDQNDSSHLLQPHRITTTIKKAAGPPITTRKSAHNRTQSISTQPVTQKKKQHSRRGSLPTAIHVNEANRFYHSSLNSPIRSPFLLSPIPPLPEKGAIAIHIANPKSDVASHYITKHENTIKNLSYILIWYFFSTSLSLYNKNLMGRDRFNFNFPLLVSAIHAGLHAIITTLMMWLGGNRWKSATVGMTLNDYLFKVVSMENILVDLVD